jgi:hypothetical protein
MTLEHALLRVAAERIEPLKMKTKKKKKKLKTKNIC